MSRDRSQTAFVTTQPLTKSEPRKSKLSKKSKKSKLTDAQRHQIILKTLQKLNKTTKIFHLRWIPGEHIDGDILISTPIFWFAKFEWSVNEIETLFNAAEVNISMDMKKEMKYVYGRQRKSMKFRKSSNNLFNNSDEKESKNEQKTDNVGMTYLRTKRLLKRVNKVQSNKTLVVNPQLKKRLTMQASKHNFINGKTKLLQNNELPSNNAQLMSPLSENKLIELDYDSENDIIDDEKVVERESMKIRDKHRRTSSISIRKNANYEAIAEIVWEKLTKTRGDELNLAQFTIEIYNCNILADPDVTHDIFGLIKVDPSKKVKKINKNLFIQAAKKTDEISLETEIADITPDNKTLVIFKQILYHIKNNKPFNISDFLTPKLKIKDLNDVNGVLTKLTSRDADWRIRLQILEWVSDKLEQENHALQDLALDKNLGNFLLGYMTQCLDERSGLSIPALEMFPNVFSITMTLNGDAFQYLNDILTSLFLVLRNQRSKKLNTVADECIIQTIDVIMDWHQSGSLDNEVLFELCEIFRDNTILKKMKHARVRERCVAYFGYILYGLDYNGKSKKKSINNSNNDSNEDKVLPFVISNEMQRKYLLKNNTFVQYASKSFVNGSEDKNGDVRTVTMKLLSKIMKSDKKILMDILMKDEPLTIKKLEKWIQRNDKKKSNKKQKKQRKRLITKNLIQKMKQHKHDPTTKQN